MLYKTTSGGGAVEILASKDFDAVPITVAAPTAAEGEEATTIVKAGTPLTAAGASTTGANAVGVLLYDVDTAVDPNGAVVVRGLIDSKKAQAHSGVTYATALYTALPAVNFRTNIGVNT